MATDTKFAGVSFYSFCFKGEHPVVIVECTTRNVFSAVEHSHKYSLFEQSYMFRSLTTIIGLPTQNLKVK